MKTECIILDSNLLLLLVVGIAGIERFKHHKRLKNFDLPNDFHLLQTILQSAAEIVLTPNTLTETSNLLRLIGDPARSELSRVLAAFIRGAGETYVASSEGAAQEEFAKLGLTDAILLHLSAKETAARQSLLLTMDFDLYIAASQNGLRTVNFNELRDL